MRVSIKKCIIIELDENEVYWLQGVIQNAPSLKESSDDHSIRKDLWQALEKISD